LYEETLVILKPDALERRLVGSIIERYEGAGLDVLDIRYIREVGEPLINKHYPESMARGLGEKAQRATKWITDTEAHGKKVLERLRRYVTRGPVIAIRLGGEEAIQTVRSRQEHGGGEGLREPGPRIRRQEGGREGTRALVPREITARAIDFPRMRR